MFVQKNRHASQRLWFSWHMSTIFQDMGVAFVPDFSHSLASKAEKWLRKATVSKQKCSKTRDTSLQKVLQPEGNFSVYLWNGWEHLSKVSGWRTSLQSNTLSEQIDSQCLCMAPRVSWDVCLAIKYPQKNKTKKDTASSRGKTLLQYWNTKGCDTSETNRPHHVATAPNSMEHRLESFLSDQKRDTQMEFPFQPTRY